MVGDDSKLELRLASSLGFDSLEGRGENPEEAIWVISMHLQRITKKLAIPGLNSH